MYLSQTSAPATTPISLSEAKAHLRVLHSDEDTLITSLITAAVSYLDGRHGILGRSLITQSWEYRIHCFPYHQVIKIPLPPLRSVVSVTYIDDNGIEQTLSPSQYVVDTSDLVGKIYSAYDITWPTTRDEPYAVRIAFTSGFGVAADVPAPIKQALLLLIGHFYLNREAVNEKTLKAAPMAVEALIGPYTFASF
ncbi:MAG: head-tail connector protein [Pseudomonadota bacterium]